MEVDLSVNIAGIKMKNPVMVASGTFASGKEYSQLLDLNKLGAIVVKTLTLKPKKGNPPPRICETASGMLNSIGLENKGVENFLEEDLPFLKRFKTPVIVSIGGETIGEYLELAKILNKIDNVHGLEVNISCPNVEYGGIEIGRDPQLASKLTGSIKNLSGVPVIFKLTPQVSDIAKIARSVEEAGADAISLINTIPAMAINIETFQSKLGGLTGGLSGPAIKPIALRMVWEVFQAVQIPLIGMGGISNAEDALEFIIAGATAVAVGTANFVNPKAVLEIVDGIEKFMIEKGFTDLSQIRGKLKC